jgi:hypothetical protein
MYNDYEFDVLEVHPSGLLSYQSGKVTTSRKFKMSCEYAEEFVLRQLGKFWSAATPYATPPSAGYPSPVLPVPFPFDWSNGQPKKYGRMNLVASSFSIEPLSAACFGNNLIGDRVPVGDPADIGQMAMYFEPTPINPDPLDPPVDNSCCECIVTISYEENPCDCCGYEPGDRDWVVDQYILPGTCLSVERNPAYEMVTIPSANLVWRDMPNSTPDEQVRRQLRSDSYAYRIIPKADIIVSWHNVPVRNICAIENHLRDFRGAVNDQAWGDVLDCDAAPTDSAACGCGQYEPETILFVDFQEDRSKRTDAFGGNYLISTDTANNMNTTTLKLVFKQKRVERPTPTASYSDSDDCPDDNDEAYGWNHLMFDQASGGEAADDFGGEWMRVAVDNATEDPLFPIKNFVDIFYPVL